MKKYIKKYNQFINEELSFPPSYIEHSKRVIGWKRIVYNFQFDGNDITVRFDCTDKEKGIYEREYTINDKFTKIKIENGNRLISHITYITECFLDDYRPTLLVIYHLPDGLEKVKNKRAYINKLYLEKSAHEYGYKYELIDIPNLDETDGKYYNSMYSFIYTNKKDVNDYLTNNALSSEKITEELSFDTLPVDYNLITDNDVRKYINLK
jgi:hypothetical protein